MFHGTYSEDWKAHKGAFMTSCEWTAGQYGPEVFEAAIDESDAEAAGLVVEVVEMDWHADEVPSLRDYPHADIIAYDDEFSGRRSTTWVVASERGAAWINDHI